MIVHVKFFGPYSEELAKLLVPTRDVLVGVGSSKALASLSAIDAYRLIDPIRAHKVAKLVDAQRPDNAEAVEGDSQCQIYCTIQVNDD